MIFLIRAYPIANPFPFEFVADHVTLFYGKAMLIVRTVNDKLGMIDVKAMSESLQSHEIELIAQ